jgi:hypothetical protein
MAKALLGHIGGSDPRILAEIALLRRRVSDLETEVLRLRAENEALTVVDGDLLTLDVTTVEAALA